MNKLYKSFIAIAASLAFFASTDAQVVNPTFVGPGGRPSTFTSHGVLLGHGTANASATAAGTAGQCLQSGGASADPTWAACATGGTGTVTSVSVATANGMAGTVATATTTPAITLTTAVSGMAKGNGTAFSTATAGTDYTAGTSGLATGVLKNTTGTGAHTIATAGTDYSLGTSALSTGILKSTTTTGALTIAVAGDFPTLNQNTSGTAANVTGTVAVGNGGTGLTATPTNGQIDIGNGTNFTRSTITAGAGVTVTNGAGTITIASTGASSEVVLLATITTTATATADSLSSFTSSYDSYFIVFEGLAPATSTGDLSFKFANGGVVDSGSNYFHPSSLLTSVDINSVVSGGVGMTGTIIINNTNTTSTRVKAGNFAYGTQLTAGPTYQSATEGFGYIGGAISGISFFWSGGLNFRAGDKIYVYGYKNT